MRLLIHKQLFILYQQPSKEFTTVPEKCYYYFNIFLNAQIPHTKIQNIDKKKVFPLMQTLICYSSHIYSNLTSLVRVVLLLFVF